MIADSWVELAAARQLVYRAAAERDARGALLSRWVSAAKLCGTETAQKVIDRSVQIFGAEGVVQDSVVERLYREVRALRIYEGTSEIQRLILSRSIFSEKDSTEP